MIRPTASSGRCTWHASASTSPPNTTRSSKPSANAAPSPMARCATSARTVAILTCSRRPAATAIARSANTAKLSSGLSGGCNANCQATTSCSPSRCPSPCARFCAATRNWAMTRCSRPLPKPSRPWCTIRASSAPIEPTSSVCSTHHPHIHYVVPGGALSSEDGAWYASSPSFFLPVKALSRLFRGKFRARIHKAALLDQILLKPGSKTGTSTARRSPTPRPRSSISPLRLQGGHLRSPHPQG